MKRIEEERKALALQSTLSESDDNETPGISQTVCHQQSDEEEKITEKQLPLPDEEHDSFDQTSSEPLTTSVSTSSSSSTASTTTSIDDDNHDEPKIASVPSIEKPTVVLPSNLRNIQQVKVLMISGKRGFGKSFMAESLIKMFLQYEQVISVRLSFASVLKDKYAKHYEFSECERRYLDDVLTFKEDHRPHLIEMANSMRAKDPFIFARIIGDRICTETQTLDDTIEKSSYKRKVSLIYIIDDCRLPVEIHWISCVVGRNNLHLLRLTNKFDGTKVEPNRLVDFHDTEIGLDQHFGGDALLRWQLTEYVCSIKVEPSVFTTHPELRLNKLAKQRAEIAQALHLSLIPKS